MSSTANGTRAVVGMTVGLVFCDLCAAQQPTWKVIKPSDTGIPGEEVRFLRFAPDGKL